MLGGILAGIRDRDLMDRVIRRIKRPVLTKPGFEYYTWRYVANARPTILAFLNQPTQPGIDKPIETLQRDGILVAPSKDMLGSLGAAALPEIRDEVLRLNEGVNTSVSGTGNKDYIARVIKEDQPLDANHPLVRVALDQKLLEVVAGYMGFWPRLSSVAAWINFPTSTAPRDAQLWHRDPEDVRIAKMFIYLDDVQDDHRGPFTYIPGTQALGRNAPAAAKFAANARTTDEELITTFPQSEWVKCTGPAGTMIIADTRGYHRGGRVENGRRLLINATYVSNHPYGKLLHRISGEPSWAPSRIQKFALRGSS